MNRKIFVILGFMVLFFPSGALRAQQTYTLDDAIVVGAKEIEANLAQGIKVVVLNFNSSSVNLSNYVIDEMMSVLVKNKKLVVVDRANLELIQKEMNFQMSGEVSDSSAQAIGQKLGAQSIISGTIQDLGRYYRVRFKVIEVMSAAVQATPSLNVSKNDMAVVTLMGNSAGSVPSNTRQPLPKPAPAPQRPASSDGSSLMDSRFWLGFRLGGSLDFYSPASEFAGDSSMSASSSFSINAAAHLGFQVFDAFALQFELLYTHDYVYLSGEEYVSGYWGGYNYFDYSFSYSSISIPLLAKFTFWPYKGTFGLLAGLSFNFPGEAYYYSSSSSGGHDNYLDISSPIALVLGMDFGFQAGHGAIFFDLRSMIDLGDTTASESGTPIFSRLKILLSVGYSFGLGQR